MGHRLKRDVRSTELAGVLGVPHAGPGVVVREIAPLSAAGAGCLTFSSGDALPAAAGTVVVGTLAKLGDASAHAVLDSASPRYDFIRLLDHLEREIGFDVPSTPPVVDPTAQLGQGCVIESDVVIGAHTVIGHNAVIKRGTRIGAHCLIRAGAVIGDEGFGFERQPDGRPLRFVHLGGVSIGDHVEIGNATMVCRGTLGDTVIESYTKIDNLVHIAHNCHLEENVMIIACAEISGAVRIGRGAWVGPNACVIQKKRIEADSLVGIGAVVLKDVEAGAVVVGNPAKVLRKDG